MRKAQKEQILNMLGLHDKAHEAIRKAVETENRGIALSLLEQCQDSAIQIGGRIEDSMGEGFSTVAMLESYCEQIYQIYECINQQQAVSSSKMYKSLRKQWIQIENSAKNDITVRMTAVFLPYKASMWDSLESVWQAADADPNCDAYVIPIPYFDKNPDGSFREMHYEGDEYPDYVPITRFEEYDIAAEHPDMIFIHNPYDEFNLVTTVPSVYYAKELKKHTNKLVYIPYFILGEVNPDNKKAVENIEHFCAVPAVVYADKVIVQSEKMRKVYIDVMTRTMGADTKKIWEEKILGLGSPKIDRVLSTQKNNLDIPKEWLEVIEKSDGSWKKIIFYNTSVSALLQHSEKMLQKLEDVLDIFKKNQEEVALLWRPHPLIKATIESMRPQLWQEYEELVKRYREEGWGIYDDTADVERAIAISDAYYGDHSSLVKMYEETGKPIMLQNVEVEEKKNSIKEEYAVGEIQEKNRINLHYRSHVRVKNKIYFSEVFFNGLFEMNLDDFSVKFLCHFSEEDNFKILLHGGHAIYFQDKVWFFPLGTTRIHYYILSRGKAGSIPLPLSDKNEFDIVGAVQRGNRVWLFPKDISSDVFVLDMENACVMKAESITRALAKYGEACGFAEIPNEGKVFRYCAPFSILLEIDLEREKVKEHKLQLNNISVCSIDYHDEMFYITDAVSGDLYEWAWGSIRLRKFTAKEKIKCVSEGPPFTGCCFVNEDIYMVPYRSSSVMKINKNEEIMEKAFDYPKDFQYLGSVRQGFLPGVVADVEVISNEIWFHPYGCNQMIIYDTKDGEIKERKLVVETDSVLFYGELNHEGQGGLMTLEDFCHGIKKCDQDGITEKEMQGNKIYQAIIE